jgi:hypothetical protein
MPANKTTPYSDFPLELLEQLMSELAKDNFTPYLTSVGGSGLGILSPWHPQNPLATPPETPEIGKEPLRAAFSVIPMPELAKLAEDRGRWLFV